MTKKDVSPFSLLVSAVVATVCGIIMMLEPNLVLGMVYFVARIVVIVVAVLTGLSFIMGKERKFLHAGLGYILLAVLIVFAPKVFASSLSTMFGLIAGIQGLVNFISFLTYKHDKVPQWKTRLVFSVIFFTFAYLIFQNPLRSIIGISKLVGIYLIFAGIAFFTDFIRDFWHTDYAREKITPRVYLPLPVFVAAMLPGKVLDAINSAMGAGEILPLRGEDYTPEGDPRLEVYVHIGNDAIGKLGHMDICFDGTVYSYGCYSAGASLIGNFISRGTLAVVDRTAYLHQSIDIEKKTLIGFGIDVDTGESDRIKARIAEVFNEATPWKSPAQTSEGEFTDPASVLFKNTSCLFFQFKGGKFKTYFALGSNCVLLAHQIIGSAGAGVLRVNGLVTPGTYYAYLDRLYNSKNTFVISRTIYKNGEIADEKSLDSGRLPK